MNHAALQQELGQVEGRLFWLVGHGTKNVWEGMGRLIDGSV